MTPTMVTLTLVLTILTTALLVEWIARSRHPRRLFFVRLGRDRTEADDARATRLRVANALVTLAGIACVVVPMGELTAVIAVTLCPLISIGWMSVEMVGAVRSAERERVPGRYVVSLEEPPKLRDYVSVPLQLAHVLLVIVPAAVFAWITSRLPAEIPAHYDLSGNVDRYASPHELWSLGGIVLFDLLLLWVIVWAVARERWALPEHDAERYAALQLERRQMIVRSIEWVMLIVNLAMVLVWLAVPLAALPGWEDLLGPAVLVTVVLSTVGAIVPLVVYVPRLMKVRDQLVEIAGTDVLGTRDAGWKWGGMIYYAPDDPALFVPKKVGIGQTLNMARPSAWVFITLVIVVPLAISLGAVALAG
ncbi:MAG: DUF1648 domain-containing protein [Sandaracinaceae bacterium]|nr:DUF1648 domain-containing protein [Sandaracinaceae bacterium]